MEDYKEKYEKAVEWLRDGLYAASRGTMKEEMEKYFPELAESDEARIRKALISLINEGRNGKAFIEIHGVPVADILAWLESKDIKNKVWIYRDVYVREKEHARKDGIDEVLANPQKYGLEKQGEQKPDDVDNKFIRMRETKPKDISEFLNRLTTVEQEFLWEHIAKIRELDKEEQKPAWSEEDDEMLQQVIADIEDLIATETGIKFLANYHRHLDWLKSLKDRVQPQPKSDWGEEDERMLNSFLHKLEVCDLLSNKEIIWIKKKLKLLRPQNTWKPSEEQIDALDKGRIYIPTTNIERKFIDSLLEDLKKLMG